MPNPAPLLATLLVSLMHLAGAAEDGLPIARFPDSFAMQTKPPTSTAEDMAGIKTLGATIIRRGFYWKGTEPNEKGVYDFSDADRVMADAEANNLRVLGVLFANNPLYESSDSGNRAPITEAGQKGFAAFAAALVERFKGRGVMWEIWNEPNTMTFWGKHGKQGNTPEYAEQYMAMVKACVPAMRAADPDCLIIAGSLSCLWEPSFTWTDACFTLGLAEIGIDAFSVHPYGFKSPEEYLAGYDRIRAILAKHNASDMPLINTERGFSIVKLEEGWSGGTPERALEFQAWHLARQHLIDAMAGMRYTVWYEWRDGPFALIIDGTTKRPAYTAARVLIEQLDTCVFQERLPLASDRDFALRFNDSEGKPRFAVWTSPPAGETPENAKLHVITIPMTGSQVSVTSLMGEASVLPIVDGSVSVEISGAPQYLRPLP